MAGRTQQQSPQLELPRTRKRDKNQQFRGGARPGAGRPKKPKSEGRASEPHQVRPAVTASQPVHVVMRATKEVGSLRKQDILGAIREATLVALSRAENFHIVHISIQRSHVHLIVEAVSRKALWKGMQVFGISAAKHINAVIGERTGTTRRRGAVFVDRYYARNLRTPREVRNCLAYVLNNWRHHREDRESLRRPWKVDPFSNGLIFDGWKERELDATRPPGILFREDIPNGYAWPVVWLPNSWLLSTGWRRYGLVSVFEVPGGGDE